MKKLLLSALALLLVAVPSVSLADTFSGEIHVTPSLATLTLTAPYSIDPHGTPTAPSFITVDPLTGAFTIGGLLVDTGSQDYCQSPAQLCSAASAMTASFSGILALSPYLVDLGGGNSFWVIPDQTWTAFGNVQVSYLYDYNGVNGPPVSGVSTLLGLYQFSIGGPLSANGNVSSYQMDVIFPAPEPSSLLLIASGLLGVVGVIRKKVRC